MCVCVCVCEYETVSTMCDPSQGRYGFSLLVELQYRIHHQSNPHIVSLSVGHVHLSEFKLVLPFVFGLDELLRVMGELLVIKKR